MTHLLCESVETQIGTINNEHFARLVCRGTNAKGEANEATIDVHSKDMVKFTGAVTKANLVIQAQTKGKQDT